MHDTLGERLASVRKRRGLSQRELAQRSRVSLSLIRQIEQGERETTRLETARKLAAALAVQTSTLALGDAEPADATTVVSWEPVRAALFGLAEPQNSDEPPPAAASVRAAMRDLLPALTANRYAEIGAVLPALIGDARTMTGNGEVRKTRSEVFNFTGWLMVQTRQWDAADVALRMSVNAAGDRLDAAAAVNTQCWLLLRQGRLANARDLASSWADQIEPRFSKATGRELAVWGRLQLGIANAEVRDNSADSAEEALDLAALAADRIGREVQSDSSTTRTFGPVTVAMIRGESAVLVDRPDKALEVARTIPPDLLHPLSASRCRHRLDVAQALVLTRKYPAALGVLEALRRDAPEWLAMQRYARDVLARIIERRRTLTADMRELADFIRVPY
jgi:transcriptional regulator with XRE-family HTH domain